MKRLLITHNITNNQAVLSLMRGRQTVAAGRFCIHAILALLVSIMIVSELSAETRYRIRPLDNLSRIVSSHYPDSTLSKAQLMAEIYARNPRAFKDGNVNFLLRGKRLILPSEETIQPMPEEQARAMLSEKGYVFRNTSDISALLSEFDLTQKDMDDLEQMDDVDQQMVSEVNGKSRRPENSPNPDGDNNNKRMMDKKLKLSQQKLKKLENEREQLRQQLERLKKEKKKADQQLKTLEQALIERAGRNSAQGNNSAQANNTAQATQTKEKQNAMRSAATSKEKRSDLSDASPSDKANELFNTTLPADVIAADRKKRLFEDKVRERTRKLKEANAALEQKLQRTRSELAENNRENISMSRQLKSIKGGDDVLENEFSGKLPDDDLLKHEAAKKADSDANPSLAEEIDAPRHVEETLDSAVSNESGGNKLLWLFAVLAFFGVLWFLLRRFMGLGGSMGKSTVSGGEESESYMTSAFEAADEIDADYEEPSLETSIKLDVARAYIEADDYNSARDMLQEVLEEGDVDQQQEARDILASLKN